MAYSKYRAFFNSSFETSLVMPLFSLGCFALHAAFCAASSLLKGSNENMLVNCGVGLHLSFFTQSSIKSFSVAQLSSVVGKYAFCVVLNCPFIRSAFTLNLSK